MIAPPFGRANFFSVYPSLSLSSLPRLSPLPLSSISLLFLYLTLFSLSSLYHSLLSFPYLSSLSTLSLSSLSLFSYSLFSLILFLISLFSVPLSVSKSLYVSLSLSFSLSLSDMVVCICVCLYVSERGGGVNITEYPTHSQYTDTRPTNQYLWLQDDENIPLADSHAPALWNAYSFWPMFLFMGVI